MLKAVNSFIMIGGFFSMFIFGIQKNQKSKKLSLTMREKQFIESISGKAKEFHEIAHNDIENTIGIINNKLRMFATSLRDIKDNEKIFINVSREISAFGNDLFNIANEQVASGQELIDQKSKFKELLEYGLKIQLFLVNLPEWAEKFNAQSQSVIIQFKNDLEQFINILLISLAQQYELSAEKLLKEKQNNKLFAQAKLMLARILVYPIATFDREPYKAAYYEQARKLEETIASKQSQSGRDIFASLNIELGKEYASQLNKIM